MDVQAEAKGRPHVHGASSKTFARPELVQRWTLGPPLAGDAMYMYLHFLLFFCGDGSTYGGQWFAPGGFASDLVRLRPPITADPLGRRTCGGEGARVVAVQPNSSTRKRSDPH